MRRVGLFGGSFDPVHNAHLALARAARDQLELDELRWIPARQPWQKGGLAAPAEDRAAMVALAIDGEPGFVLDRSELAPGTSGYTVDTVRRLQSASSPARWWLVIGQDQYDHFTSWHDWQALLERVTLAVAARPGTSPAELAAEAIACEPISLPPMHDSATEIRHRLQQGEPISGLVPGTVARYIAEHRLYAS